MKNALGTGINHLRNKKRITLKTLAHQTGFSISFLSQLEHGKCSATLESLKKISLALDVSPGYFFNEENENIKGEQLFKRNSLEQEQMKKHKVYYKTLSGMVDNPQFLPQQVILKPGQNEGNLIKHPGQEFLYVLKGILTIQIDNETCILHPNDSIMFDSGKKHYWYNYTESDVEFLCINYDNMLNT